MKCTIRKWRTEDARDLAQALSNKKILDNLRDGLPYPYSEDDALEFINANLSADTDETFAFAIDIDGKAVGSIAAYRQQNIHCRTAELGYYIAEEFWGKGIATCAVKQICDHVFDNSDVVRIFAEPFKRNAASCRVLEKCGFKLEGVMRANAIKNGIVEDMALYARLKSDKE